jgi:hypothetical protein
VFIVVIFTIIVIMVIIIIVIVIVVIYLFATSFPLQGVFLWANTESWGPNRQPGG